MGLWDRLTSEFVDVIEWTDDSPDTMVYRYQHGGSEIKYGAMLTVRESQTAVFVNEGQIADVFPPGLYRLETANLPILTTLQSWPFGFKSPFKAEVYFLSTRQFTDLKWGTKNPLMLRDPEFGPVRLRGFGTYSIRIGDAAQFLKEIAGTDGHFTTKQIMDQLRNIIVSRFASVLGESGIPILDLAANYDDLSDFITAQISPEFKEYGLGITKFLVENISLPKAVEEAMDERSKMGVIGNLKNYAEFQAAQAMREAAANPANGGAAMGVGLGMGMAMAKKIGDTFSVAHNEPAPAAAVPPPIPGQTSVKYFIAKGAKPSGPFTLDELADMAIKKSLDKKSLVWRAGMQSWEPAASVADVASLFAQIPPPLPAAASKSTTAKKATSKTAKKSSSRSKGKKKSK